MKTLKYSVAILSILFMAFAVSGQKVVQITVDGAINPVVSDYIAAGIKKATDEKAECLIINLNTPGGLLKSTRVIVSEMLESKVPIVVYVSPSGAHAGSAGVFITLAAHIAVMAPGTNLGSAHPVNLQGGMDSIMGEKTTNDAAAFIRSIAEKRGRNMEWAEDAVRFSVSLAETEAVKKNVVDFIAEDEEGLLAQINGWVVNMEKGPKTLNTEGAEIARVEMTWGQKLLNYISDPNIAYILMLFGIYGLIFEFYNPGVGFPGVVGGISLILAFYAMHTLPINIAGLALIALAIVLFILELSTPTNGILSVGAVVSLLLGSIMLIKPGVSFEWAKISLGVIIPAVIVTTLFFVAILGIGIKAQANKVSTGLEGLVGDVGKAMTDLNPTGNVFVQGEIWSAKTKGAVIEKGQEVKVLAVHGLTITVESVS